MVLSVKKFNEQQETQYNEYKNKCISNGVKPEPFERYFYKFKINYGFVYKNRFNEIFWKKRKKDFNI